MPFLYSTLQYTKHNDKENQKFKKAETEPILSISWERESHIQFMYSAVAKEVID